MKIIKGILKFILKVILFAIVLLIAICIYHKIMNAREGDPQAPGDKIEVYDGEYIHAVLKPGNKYTIVMLPGMGSASPYYDFYKLANKVSEKYSVIIMEPLGYGFSSETNKERTLDNYEYELSKVLDYYNIDDNIILLGHSYSGISNLNYANKHKEVKGLVCLDCTTAYQIETHLDKPTTKMPMILSYISPLGIVRIGYSKIFSNNKKELEKMMVDIPEEFKDEYKHLLFNRTLNETIVNEVNDIYYNQLKLYENKYREDLNVITILSDETIKEMKEYKKEGSFKHDWEEMHNLLISNSNKQKIEILIGDHYIHHDNVDEVNKLIDKMISNIK